MSSPAPDPLPDPAFTDLTVTIGPGAPLPGATPPRLEGDTGTVSAAGGNSDRSPVAFHAPELPGYELLAELGRGGMGVVYKARQKGLNRIVALKVVLAGGHASAGQRARFLAEAEAVALLSHPGIVGVYEFGTWDSQPYITLEYCPGGTLADKLRGTPTPPREGATLVERLSRAVASAHTRGVVHRDIKPANIMLADDGTPKITDFGLAKMRDVAGSLTVTGAVMGTPSYMAPEQARGDAKSVGPAADVYALGAVLYECLTGRPPFRGASAADTIVQSLEREPVGVRALNPLVPVDLETVCLKCLEKDAARRYPTGTELADDLERFLAGRPVIARPVGPLGRARRWVARNQVVTGLLVAFVLAIAAGTTATYVKYLDEAEQHAVAEREREKAEAETVAKEDALQKLRKTLEALQALTAEQQQTLARLTEEKAATEDALLRGLLRPLRNTQAGSISLEETRALFELAAHPEERFRFRFVDRGLATPEGADKLASWPREVVGAVVGLDQAAAVRLRGVVGRTLRAPATSANSRVACAFLAGALPHDDADFNHLAALTLAERVAAAPDSQTVGELMPGLLGLAPRLRGESASAVARLLAERLVKESDPATLNNLGYSWVSMLPPTDAAAAGQKIVDRVAAETDTNILAPLMNSFLLLARQLTPTDAEALALRLSQAMADGLPAAKESASAYHRATVLAELASRLPPGGERVIVPALRALAARVAVEKDTSLLPGFAGPLASLTPLAPPAERDAALEAFVTRTLAENDPGTFGSLASSLVGLTHSAPRAVPVLTRRYAERFDADADPYILSNLCYLISGSAQLLSPTEAAALVRRPLLGVAARLAAERDASLVYQWANALANLAPYASPADAASAAKSVCERHTTDREQFFVSTMTTGVAPITNRLEARDALAFSRIYAARIAGEKDAATLSQYANSLGFLTGRLPQAEAAAVVRPVVRLVLGRLATEKDANAVANLGSVLAYLAPRLLPDEAAAAAKPLAARLAAERELYIVSNLPTGLLALTAQAGASAEPAILAPAARALGKRLATDKDTFTLNGANIALTSLAPRLAPADAAAIAAPIAARLGAERDPNTYYYLSGPLSSLALSLTPADAAAVARPLLARFQNEKDNTAQANLSSPLANLAPRLDAENTTALARLVAARMTSDKDANALSRFIEVFSPLPRRLSDADLLALLKSHAPFPPIRDPILAEFGRRSGRTHTPGAIAAAGAAGVLASEPPAFPGVWDFVEWAGQNRPEWNLRGR